MAHMHSPPTEKKQEAGEASRGKWIAAGNITPGVIQECRGGEDAELDEKVASGSLTEVGNDKNLQERGICIDS
jgi:hypothetical protein